MSGNRTAAAASGGRKVALLAAALASAALPTGCKRLLHRHSAASARASASAAPSAASAASAHSIASAIPTAHDIAEPGAIQQNHGVNAIGEKVNAPDYSMTLVSVKECQSKQYYHPRPGNMWLGVQVKLQSTSDHELRVNPFYATLHDSGQHTYTPTFGGCHPTLKSMRMKKGDKTRGWITFELPRSATGIRLVYDPFVVGGPSQPLQFLVVR